MKAIVCKKYGSPDVLQLEEVEKPIPTDNEVLVKVHASSLNAADLDQLSGTFLIRLQGLLKPKYKIPGSDVAGRIETIGKNVKDFQPGDDIFVDLYNYGFGAFAEYVCVPEDAIRLKPLNMSFKEAATIPQAAVVALQGLRDKKQIQPGEKVLINGAGGGMGSFAVQIAKIFGAEVTGVDNTGKLDMIQSIGADHVIDYTQEDFTKSGETYDLILDVAAYHSVFDCKRALNPEGIYIIVGGSTSVILGAAFLGPLITKKEDKKMGLLMWNPNKKEDMEYLGELHKAGKVVPVIERSYSLSEVAEAYRHLEEGNVKGKLVITM